MTDVDYGLLEGIEEFYRDYYKEEIHDLARAFPKDQTSLYVAYDDIFRFDPSLADDLMDQPEKVLGNFEEALPLVDLPIDVDLSDATVRVTGLPESATVTPADLRSKDAGDLLAVRGTLAQTTGVVDRPEMLVFECSAGHKVEIPQDGTSITEPTGCSKCEGRPNWEIVTEAGEWVDQLKIRVETPPDETGAIEGDEITGYVRDDLVNYGSDFGPAGRTGERVTVVGIVRREQRDQRGASGLVFDRYLDVLALEFPADQDDVDAAQHKSDFEDLATTDDPVTLWKQSLAPELHPTPEWDAAFELGVAYLFGAPRIDVDGGPTYRGDIHMLIVSDYGMGKSTFTQGIAEYSPKCLKKSATGLGSDVGLTAAAVKDDSFGEGTWTLKPGILVRGNGGHVILDEIDKGPDDLHKMNDALEGEQTVSVEKAGQDATFNSKVGLLATGNPTDGKFNHNAPISEQIDVSPSLLSRFDGIVTMRDRPDESVDADVAEHIGTAYREAAEVAYEDREDMDVLERPVPVDVGQAWVKYARENIQPIITADQITNIRDWYATEVRKINEDMGQDNGTDPPVPVTARAVEDTVRIAVAFARAELRETVADHNVTRAKELVKTLAGQTFSDDGFAPLEVREHATSQAERVDRVKTALQDSDGMSVGNLAGKTGLSQDAVQSVVDTLSEKGVLYTPERGVYALA